jgi:predicted P-loop ATPase
MERSSSRHRHGKPEITSRKRNAALREHPAWFGVLAYDEFARETILLASPPWDAGVSQWQQRAWSAHDDLLAAEWLQRQEIAVNSTVAAQAVEAVSRDHSIHPVKEYLENLQHDGKVRLECQSAFKFDPSLECAPDGGQF